MNIVLTACVKPTTVLQAKVKQAPMLHVALKPVKQVKEPLPDLLTIYRLAKL